eukprot:TRINITY_DN387_c0_g1_i6.p1 TRINITY_DN387_c0_g1~~TRINITY_DN387_c0_g1_i6.p1  ORF type:complete len:934 (+),score=209.35 TRINITY_DN387_c0_g1_i6:44-2845(+)
MSLATSVLEVFRHFDVDNDGYWSFAEASEAFRELYGKDLDTAEYVEKCKGCAGGFPPASLKIMYARDLPQLDKDVKTISSLQKAPLPSPAPPPSSSSVTSTKTAAMIDTVFTYFDIDKDGFWNYSEAQAARFHLTGDELTREDFEELCGEMFAEPHEGWGEEHLAALYADDEDMLHNDYKNVCKKMRSRGSKSSTGSKKSSENSRKTHPLKKTSNEEEPAGGGLASFDFVSLRNETEPPTQKETTSDEKEKVGDSFGFELSQKESRKDTFDFGPTQKETTSDGGFASFGFEPSKKESHPLKKEKLGGPASRGSSHSEPKPPTPNEGGGFASFDFGPPQKETTSVEKEKVEGVTSFGFEPSQKEGHPLKKEKPVGLASRGSSNSVPKPPTPNEGELASFDFGSGKEAEQAHPLKSEKSSKGGAFDFGPPQPRKEPFDVLPLQGSTRSRGSDKGKAFTPSVSTMPEDTEDAKGFTISGKENHPLQLKTLTPTSSVESLRKPPSSSSVKTAAMVDTVFTYFDIDKDGFWNYSEAQAARFHLTGDELTREDFEELCGEMFAEPHEGWGEEHLAALYADDKDMLHNDYQHVCVRKKAYERPANTITPKASFNRMNSMNSSGRQSTASKPSKAASTTTGRWFEPHASEKSNSSQNSLKRHPLSKNEEKNEGQSQTVSVKSHPLMPVNPEDTAEAQVEHQQLDVRVDEGLIIGVEEIPLTAERYVRMPFNVKGMDKEYRKMAEASHCGEGMRRVKELISDTDGMGLMLRHVAEKHEDLGVGLKEALKYKIQEERNMLTLNRDNCKRMGVFRTPPYIAPNFRDYGGPPMPHAYYVPRITPTNIHAILATIETTTANLFKFPRTELTEALKAHHSEGNQLRSLSRSILTYRDHLKGTMQFLTNVRLHKMQLANRLNERNYQRHLRNLQQAEDALLTDRYTCL